MGRLERIKRYSREWRADMWLDFSRGQRKMETRTKGRTSEPRTELHVQKERVQCILFQKQGKQENTQIYIYKIHRKCHSKKNIHTDGKTTIKRNGQMIT